MRQAACAIALLIAAPLWAHVDLTEPFAPDAQTVQLLHLDDVAGGQCADAVGGPAGTVKAGKPGLGRFGGGLALDGAEGWVDVTRDGRSTSPRPTEAITVECWVKFRRAAQGDILCRNMAYMMRINGGITAYLSLDGKWRQVAGSRPVPVGRWTHLAMSYDQADQLVRITIDGRLDVARKPEGITAGKLDAGSETLRLGTNDWSPGAGELDGVLDEVRISSVARTYIPLPQPGRPPVPENVNLLLNPGFELGRHGWRPDGEADGNLQWELSSGDAAEGKHFLRSLDTDRGYTLLSYPVAIVPGKTHTLSVALRADQETNGRLALTSTGLAQGARLTGRSQTVKIGTAWQRFSLKYDIPKDFPSDHVYVRVDKPAGVKLDVDAASLVVGEDADFAATDATQFGARLDLPAGNTFDLGKPARIAATLLNNSQAPRQTAMGYRLANWRGKQVAAGRLRDGPLTPGDTPATCTIPTDRVGWYTLTVDTSVDGKPVSSVPYVVNVVEPLAQRGEAYSSPLGMNTHMEREPGAHLQHNLGALARCGVKWIRGWWGWGMAEKQPGQFDWTEFDRQYNDVHAAGMEIMPILLRYYPQYEQAWAGKMDKIQEPPYDVQQWGNFVTAVVKRFKGRIRAWEVWNEPQYSMDAKEYAGILKMTYERVKAADPQALVVGFGGVSLDFIRDTFAAGAAQSLDVLSHHSYSALTQPFVAEEKLQQETLDLLKQATVNVPIWHSEQGSGADGAGYLGMAATEEACAVNLVQSYLSTLATGVQKFFWFSAQTSPTYGWAVYYEDYIARPRLVALNGLARLLQGREVKGRLPLAEGRVAGVLLDGPAGPAAAVWNLRDSLTLTVAGRGLEAADMLCNPLPSSGEKQALSLRQGRPVYVLGKGMALAALQERLRRAVVSTADELPLEVTLAADGAERLQITVKNTSDQSLDADVQVSAPAQHAGAPPVEIRDLMPGTTSTASVAIKPVAGSKYDVRVTLGGVELRQVTLVRQPQ